MKFTRDLSIDKIYWPFKLSIWDNLLYNIIKLVLLYGKDLFYEKFL